jgi:hypothetical protein
MAAVKVGQIWELKGTSRRALVIFVRTKSGKHADDVRVVPLYADDRSVKLATDRDVVIPSTKNPLGTPVLAACWNTRSLERGELQHYLGQVSDVVVDAIRTIEMSCIIPDMDLSAAFGWQGVEPVAEAEIDAASEFQLAELRLWDDAIDAIRAQADDPTEVLAKQCYAPGRLRDGSYVSDDLIGYYEAVFHEWEIVAPTLGHGPDIDDPGILGPSTPELPLSGAVIVLGPSSFGMAA